MEDNRRSHYWKCKSLEIAVTYPVFGINASGTAVSLVVTVHQEAINGTPTIGINPIHTCKCPNGDYHKLNKSAVIIIIISYNIYIYH